MDMGWEDVPFASHFIMKLPVTPSCLFNRQCRVHRPPWLYVSTGQRKLLPDGDHSVGVTSAGTGFVTGCNGCVLMILGNTKPYKRQLSCTCPHGVLADTGYLVANSYGPCICTYGKNS